MKNFVIAITLAACVSIDVWDRYADRFLEPATICEGRQWWRLKENDWRLVMTRERNGKVCILARIFAPPWRQTCLADRDAIEWEA